MEADIRGFLDNLDHEWLMRMLEQRIDDRAFLRLIRKWLKAGVLVTGGQVIHPVTGTPQGGVVSPVLANVYLHYALDLWFEKVMNPHCRGEACLVRYIERPRITERRGQRRPPRPATAFAEARTPEEPGAGKPHAGICAGAAR